MTSALPESRFDSILNNDKYDSARGSRIVRTRVKSVIDGDTFFVEDPSITKGIRLAGVDTPEVSHPENFFPRKDSTSPPGNPLSKFNLLRYQPYSREATDFTSSLIGGQEVTLIIRGYDANGRPLARVLTEDGKDLSQELIKRGLGNPYFPGDPYYDPNVMTEEIQGIAVSNIVNKVGLYSNTNYVHPVKYKHGVLEWLGTSRREDLRVWAQYNAEHIAEKYGVDNKQLAPLFDTTNLLGGISVPSRRGASYFYAVALHNNMMRQAGYNAETLGSEDLGVLSSLYRIAVLKQPNQVLSQIPGSVQLFDKELSTPGLGAVLNERLFIPNGYGRLYKDEVGLLPSIMGAIGSVLDKTYLYYSDTRSDQEKLSESLNKGASYKEPKEGFFESALTFGTNLVLSSASAISLYLAVGEPLNLIMAEGIKTQSQEFINLALSNTQAEGFFANFVRNSAKSMTLGVGSLQGGSTPLDIKFALLERSIELRRNGQEFYSTSTFGLSPYHMTSLFRERAANLANSLIRPTLIEHVNPYPMGSDETKKFITAIDKFIGTVGQAVGINFELSNNYQNLDQLLEAAVKDKNVLNDVTVSITHAGMQRQQNVARDLQGLLELVPLNPLNWRVFSGQVASGTQITMLGSIFSFDEATQYMRRMIYGSGGLSSVFARSEVIGGSTTIGRLNGKMQSLFRMASISLSEGYRRVSSQLKIVRELNKSTSLFKGAESSLIQEGLIKWNSSGDARLITGVSTNGVSIFDALAEYEDFMVRGGPSIDNIADLGDRLAKAEISKLTSATAGQLLKPGLGADPTLSITRAKFALYTVIGLDLMLIGNEIFQSTGGASIFSQVATAITTGKLGLSPEFTGNKILPTGFNSVINYTAPVAMAGLLLWGARQMAAGIQKPLNMAYEIEHKALIEMADREGLQLMTDNDLNKALGRALSEAPDKGIRHLVKLNEAGRVIKSATLFEKMGHGLSYYRTAAIIRMQGDLGLNTAIFFGIGMLALGGVRNSIASILQGTRDLTTSTSGLTGSPHASLDPLIFGMSGAVAGFTMAKMMGRGAAIATALGGLSGAAGFTLLNMFGLRVTDIGIGANKVNPLNASAVSQLSGYKALIQERISQGQKVSSIEMMAAFYSGEMAKVMPALDDKNLGPAVQVIAKQAPLPFLQFFLAKTIKGRPVMDNGMPDPSAPGTSYYSVGIQSAPMFGISISTQLPIKLYSNEKSLLPGIAYNDQSNMLDIVQAASYIGGMASLTMGTAKLLSRSMAALIGPDGIYMKGAHFASFSPAIELIDNTHSFINKFVNMLEAVPATGINIVRSMFSVDADMYMHLTRNLYEKYPINKAALEAERSKARIGRAIAGGFLGMIAGNFAGSLMTHGDPVGSTVGGYVGTGVGIALNTFIAPWIQTTGKDYIYSAARKAGTKFTAIYNSMSAPIRESLTGFATSLWRNPFMKSIWNQKKALVVAGVASYFMTDPNFGMTKGMDRYDQERGPDLLYRLLVMGTYSTIMSTIAHRVGRVGLSPSSTLESYANLLEKKRSLNEVIGGDYSDFKKAGARMERFWLGLWEKGLARDSTYIIEASSSLKDPLLQGDHLKSLESYNRLVIDQTKANMFRMDAGQPIFDSTTDESIDLLIGRKGLDEVGYLKNIAAHAKEIKSLGKRVMPTLTSRRAIRTLAPVVIATSIIGTLLTGGNDNREGLNNFIDFLQTGGGTGWEPIKYIGSAMADVFRLITGLDRTVPNMGPLPVPLSPGQAFGQSPYQVKYQKLIKDRSNEGMGKVWKDINKLFVLDEPNAFIGFYNLFGMTFRPGEYGGRQSFYIQLQSAVQDVSTAVYSMSSAFLFKEALAGSDQLQLNVIAAMKEISSMSRSEYGLTRLSQKDTRRAAANLLSITAHLQPLTSRRKISKIDSGQIDFIATDDLIATAVDDRNRLTANMSFQPATSLVSRMLMDALNHKDAMHMIGAMLSGDRSVIYDLFNDAFNNNRRNLEILGVKFFSFDSKADKMSSSRAYFNDPSQWTTMYSVFNQYERPGTDMFSILDYGSSMISPILPGPLKTIVLGAAGLFAGATAISFLTTIGLKHQFEELRTEVDKYFGQTWYTEGGVRGAPDKGRSFTVRRMKGAMGRPIEGKSPLVLHKGSRYMYMNGSLIKGTPGLDDQLIRNLNEAMGFLEQAIENSYMGKIYGDTAKASFLDHMRNTVNEKLTQDALTDYTPGGERATYVEKIKSQYKSEVRNVMDNYFKALESIEVNVPGKGSLKLISFFNPEIDLAGGGLSSLGDLERSYIAFEDMRRRTIDSVELAIDQIVEREIRGGGLFGSGRLSDNLIHSMKGDVENSIKMLTEKVLHQLTTSRAFHNMRHSLGGFGSFMNMDFVFNMQKEFKAVVGNSFSSVSRLTTRFLPRETPGTKVSSSVITSTSEMAEEAPLTRSLSKAAIRGQSSIWRGLNTVWQGAGFILDLFQSFNIFSTFSRLSGAQASDKYTEGERIMMRNEAGSSVMNVGIGFGLTYSVLKLGGLASKIPQLWALVSGGAATAGGLAAVSGPPGWVVAAIVATLVVAGVGLAATWKNFGGPLLERVMNSKAVKNTTSAIGNAYYWASDGIGYLLGEAIPNVFASIGGDRAKAATTSAIGAGLGGLSLGAAISLLTAGALTGGTIGLVALAAAGIGGIAGLLFPKEVARVSAAISNAVAGWRIGNVPIGSMLLGTEPGAVYGRDIYGFSHPGSPFTIGTAQQAIDEEYRSQLQSAGDSTGKQMARHFTNPSMYGQASYDTPNTEHWTRSSSSIRPANVMADALVSREIQIRAQYYNQSIIGRYMWRTTAKAAANYNKIDKYERQQELAVAQQALELLKTTGNLKIKSLMTDKITVAKLEEAGVLSALGEVNALIEVINSKKSQQVVATVSKKDITSRKADSTNLNSSIQTGVKPIIKKEITTSTSGSSTSIKKDKAADNDVYSAATQYLCNKCNIQTTGLVRG